MDTVLPACHTFLFCNNADKPQRLHPSFSLKAGYFAFVALKSSSLEWGRRELNSISFNMCNARIFVNTQYTLPAG